MAVSRQTIAPLFPITYEQGEARVTMPETFDNIHETLARFERFFRSVVGSKIKEFSSKKISEIFGSKAYVNPRALYGEVNPF